MEITGRDRWVIGLLEDSLGDIRAPGTKQIHVEEMQQVLVLRIDPLS